mmetsp:Transcript_59060/g.117357  ORF Transcript_59060/g.117357 Transcript_59060/m.117357 type:complete len:374 (-) Transcript_59060:45-1166(-)
MNFPEATTPPFRLTHTDTACTVWNFRFCIVYASGRRTVDHNKTPSLRFVRAARLLHSTKACVMALSHAERAKVAAARYIADEPTHSSHHTLGQAHTITGPQRICDPVGDDSAVAAEARGAAISVLLRLEASLPLQRLDQLCDHALLQHLLGHARVRTAAATVVIVARQTPRRLAQSKEVARPRRIRGRRVPKACKRPASIRPKAVKVIVEEGPLPFMPTDLALGALAGVGRAAGPSVRRTLSGSVPVLLRGHRLASLANPSGKRQRARCQPALLLRAARTGQRLKARSSSTEGVARKREGEPLDPSDEVPQLGLSGADRRHSGGRRGLRCLLSVRCGLGGRREVGWPRHGRLRRPFGGTGVAHALAELERWWA